MLMTYQYKLNPTAEQASTVEVWGELLRRHYNYALGQRLGWLRRTRYLESGKTDAWTHGKLAAEDTWVQVL